MTGKEGHIPGESEAVAMINYDSEPSLRDLQGLMTVSRPRAGPTRMITVTGIM